MATITQVVEGKRGCGYRKKGLYLRLEGAGTRSCGKLPFELTICPCCGDGIKHSKGWRWVTPQLFSTVPCAYSETGLCNTCPLGGDKDKKMGLIWIGKEHYPTPFHFVREAQTMGISRRIAAVPRDFKAGETWVLLAHMEAIQKHSETSEDHEYVAGIFHAFKPSHVEYVMDGSETMDELDAFEERGIRIVEVMVSGDDDEEGGLDDDDDDWEYEEDL